MTPDPQWGGDTKSTKIKLQKSAKNLSEDYIQITCTSSNLDKNICSFKKDQAKIVGGVVFTRYPVSISFGRNEPKIDLVQTAKKLTNLYLRITAKPHAHL